MTTTAQLYAELWISLASLLRSYTAVHGISSKRQATVEQDEEHISVRNGQHSLELLRQRAIVIWKREDGRAGTLELTEAGTLRSGDAEEEMDMAAEQWARELML